MRRFSTFLCKYFCSIGLFIYSITLGVFTKHGRRMVSLICEHFRMNIDGRAKASLPAQKLEDVCGNMPIQIYEPYGRDGNVDLPELCALAMLCRMIRPSRVFEIGTFDGRTTMNLAANSPDTCEVFTLDIPVEMLSDIEFEFKEEEEAYIWSHTPGSRFSEIPIEDFPPKTRIKQLLGDSATFDFSPWLNTCKMVFVDGAHTYDYVKNDTEIAFKLLRNKIGCIVWHDYSRSRGVTKAVDELAKAHPEYSIKHIAGTTLAVYIERGMSE